MTQPENAPAKIKKRSIPLHFGLCLAGGSANISTAVICTCMHMLCVPTVLISMLVNISQLINREIYTTRISFYNNVSPYINIACIALIIAVLLGSNAAMNSFSHLYDKQKVDMELSLPLSDKQRFVSGYLAGLGVYILPYIAAQTVSLILFLAGHLAFDGKTVWDQYGGSYTVIDEFEEMFPYYAKLAVGGLFIMIMFYTMWVLTMTFCGSKLEAVLYGAGANLIMPAVFGSAAILINDVMYGADLKSYFIPNKGSISGVLLACTSPAGAVIALAENVTGVSEQSLFGFIFSLVIVTAVFFAAAMYVYCRRKAEDTGKAFVVKGFYYFVLSCMVFFIFTALTVMDIGIIPVIIVSGVAYIILDCISERGVKKIWLSCIRYAVTAAVCASLYFLVSATDCFGAAYRVPDVSQVRSVTISGYKGIFNNLSTGSSDGMYTFSGDEAVGIITDMHRTQLDLYKNDHELNEFVFSDGLPYYSNYHTVQLTYTLKNGSKMYRKYRVFKNAWEKLLPLDVTEEAKENRIRDIRTFAENIKRLENGRVNIYGRYDPVYDFGYSNMKSIRLPDGFADKFAQCAEEDIRALTLEEYIHTERASYGRMTVSSETPYMSYGMQLPAYFKRTAEYLYSIDLDFDSLNNFGTHFANYVYEGNHNHNIRIYSFDPEISDADELLNILNNYPYSEYDPAEHSIGIYNVDAEDIMSIAEIFANSIDGYIPHAECYTIDVDGISEYAYYIPERYNSTVEDILKKYNSYTN